jgi:MFS family permease
MAGLATALEAGPLLDDGVRTRRRRKDQVTALEEFRSGWSNLLGTCFGLATGVALSFYSLSVFGPALIADLGWTRSQFALVGSLPLVTLVLHPAAGRFVDRVGARTAVAVGFIVVVLCFLALSMMTGKLWEFLAINTVLGLFGLLTSSLALGRAIIDRFDRARGLALSLMMSASPISGALAAPLLGDVIAESGWRAGYLVLAGVSTVGGLIAVALIGPAPHPAAVLRERSKLSRAEFVGILRNPAFPVLMAGMFLVNLPQAFASSQLVLIALAHGVSSSLATLMVSLYAGGVIVGRWICGLALDRAPAHLVAVVALSIPTLSYIVFASEIMATPVLIAAVLAVGLAQGAEGDVGAVIVSRRFNEKNFSLLFSIMGMALATGSAMGSLLLSFMLRRDDSYRPFIIVCAATALLGALLVGLTGFIGRRPAADKAGGVEAGEKRIENIGEA